MAFDIRLLMLAILTAIIVGLAVYRWRCHRQFRILRKWGVKANPRWQWRLYGLDPWRKCFSCTMERFARLPNNRLADHEWWLVEGHGPPRHAHGPEQEVHIIHRGRIDPNDWNCEADPHQAWRDGDNNRLCFQLTDRDGYNGAIIVQGDNPILLFGQVLRTVTNYRGIPNIWARRISRESTAIFEEVKESPTMAHLQEVLERPFKFPEGLIGNLL